MNKIFLILIGVALLLKGASDPIVFNGPYSFFCKGEVFFIEYLYTKKPVLAVNREDVIYCVDLEHMDYGTLDRNLKVIGNKP